MCGKGKRSPDRPKTAYADLYERFAVRLPLPHGLICRCLCMQTVMSISLPTCPCRMALIGRSLRTQTAMSISLPAHAAWH